MQSSATSTNASLALRLAAHGLELAASHHGADCRAMATEHGSYLDAVAVSFAQQSKRFPTHSVIRLAGPWKAEADAFAAQKDHVRARRIQGAKGYSAATYEWEDGGIDWAVLVGQHSESIKAWVAFNDGTSDHAGHAYSIEIGHRVADGHDRALYAFMIPERLLFPRDSAHQAALELEESKSHAALGPDGFSRIIEAALYAVGAHLVARNVEHPVAVA